MVRPKKHLGQHFLRDPNIARKIVDSLTEDGDVLEVGPGTGVLTGMLLDRPGIHLRVVEIDPESVLHLRENFPALSGKILEADILEMELTSVFEEKFSVIGNFPYNISSQIFFSILRHRDHVRQVVCMVQKEVADRIASPPGNKTYGILSVLLQAFFDIEILFKVPPTVFFPQPKVMSSVIRLNRNSRAELECDEDLFFRIVRQVFQFRRKTLRNGLKGLNLPAEFLSQAKFNLRPEQLSVNQFEDMVAAIGKMVKG